MKCNGKKKRYNAYHMGQTHICDKITQSEIQCNIKLNYYSTSLYATVWPGNKMIMSHCEINTDIEK